MHINSSFSNLRSFPFYIPERLEEEDDPISFECRIRRKTVWWLFLFPSLRRHLLYTFLFLRVFNLLLSFKGFRSFSASDFCFIFPIPLVVPLDSVNKFLSLIFLQYCSGFVKIEKKKTLFKWMNRKEKERKIWIDG